MLGQTAGFPEHEDPLVHSGTYCCRCVFRLQQWGKQQYLWRAGTGAMMSSGNQKCPIIWNVFIIFGFTGSSAGKESACNTGDPSLIPGSRRTAEEGTGYPLQYSWASLVDQMVKNLPAMWETWVQFLGWEDPLEKGMVAHSSILTWRPKEPGRLQSVHEVTKSWTWLSNFDALFHYFNWYKPAFL